jgi:D-xylose transport system substrate-binding protein
MRSKTLALAAVGAGVALALSACGANSAAPPSSGGNTASSAPAASGGGTKVGVILPETATSARWEGFDKPMIIEAMKAHGLDADVQNAQGDTTKFAQLADGMITQGVKVLVIASINSDLGKTVATKAAAAGIPVIDYDRLNLGGSSKYYVSFDNTKVGELQGQALADSLKSKAGASVIEIEGAPTDNNATLFYNGQQKILKPLYTAGTLKLFKSQPIDGWDNQKGGNTFEQFLTQAGGKIDGVVAANDGLAGAVITILKKNGLKVPVTGQDATAAGLQAVLRGDQYMTVFKPIKQEAEAAAKLAAALAKGDTAGADAIATQKEHDPTGNRDVPSVLLTPQTITKDNVKLVVDQKYVTAAELCVGDVQALCTAAGIS